MKKVFPLFATALSFGFSLSVVWKFIETINGAMLNALIFFNGN